MTEWRGCPFDFAQGRLPPVKTPAVRPANREPCELLYYGFLPRFLSGMAELIWDGKYDVHGNKRAPVRIELPFQTVETVNESAQERQRTLEISSSGHDPEWRNHLIWGDKKYVLPSLLPEFAGKVDLIYIDPPFDTGADFSFTTMLPESDEALAKEPSVLEQKAYRDTWSKGLDSYLPWFYQTVVLLREFLSDSGTLYVHLDWHVGHYAQAVLEEVFGSDNFVNDVTWYYYNKFAPESKCFPRASDRIMVYAKSFGNHVFNKQEETRDVAVKQLKRKFIGGKAINVRDGNGVVQYQEKTTRRVDDVWRISMLQPADREENLRFPTQKPERLLDRVIRASTNERNLVLDCFCGSGTTAAVAEKLNRRWIACDLGRFAIHTTRKRLLGIPRSKAVCCPEPRQIRAPGMAGGRVRNVPRRGGRPRPPGGAKLRSNCSW